MRIPKHLQIETVNGICTSRCVMCTYKKWTRKPNIMKNDIFEKILTKFVPYRENFNYLTLHGNGEPLVDSGLISRTYVVAIRFRKVLSLKRTLSPFITLGCV